MLKDLEKPNFRDAADYALIWIDDPIKADKWRNIMFDREGRSYRAKGLHNSEEEARAAAEVCVRQCEQDAIEGLHPFLYSLDGNLRFVDFSYAIQMLA